MAKKPHLMPNGVLGVMTYKVPTLVYQTDKYFPCRLPFLNEMVDEFEKEASVLGLELWGTEIGIGEKPRRENLITIYAKVRTGPPSVLEKIYSFQSIFG